MIGVDETYNDLNSEHQSRIALLEYYYSKSTSQATIVLTLALSYFAFVGSIGSVKEWLALDPIWYLVINSVILWILLSLGIRAFGRLVQYGQLSGAVLCVKGIERKDRIDMMK